MSRRSAGGTSVARPGDVISHVLADWTTLRGPLGALTIRQSESEWLELEGFRDVTAWFQVSQATAGGATFSVDLETSPTLDQELFAAMTSTALTPGVFVAIARGNQLASATPLRKVLRWAMQISAPANWSITFRIVLALNPVIPGFRMEKNGQTFTNPAMGGM